MSNKHSHAGITRLPAKEANPPGSADALAAIARVKAELREVKPLARRKGSAQLMQHARSLRGRM